MLALKVQSLEKALERMSKAHNENLGQISRAFQMTDLHFHVLQRITKDVFKAIPEEAARAAGVKMSEDGQEVDVPAYYREWDQVRIAAGPLCDEALALWARGVGPEDAVRTVRAQAEQKQQKQQAAAPAASEQYEDHEFGGDYGQANHEPVTAAAQANG